MPDGSDLASRSFESEPHPPSPLTQGWGTAGEDAHHFRWASGSCPWLAGRQEQRPHPMVARQVCPTPRSAFQPRTPGPPRPPACSAVCACRCCGNCIGKCWARWAGDRLGQAGAQGGGWGRRLCWDGLLGPTPNPAARSHPPHPRPRSTGSLWWVARCGPAGPATPPVSHLFPSSGDQCLVTCIPKPPSELRLPWKQGQCPRSPVSIPG